MITAPRVRTRKKTYLQERKSPYQGVGDGSVVQVDSHGNILNPLSPARGLYIRGVNEMIAVVVARSAKFSARRAARPFHPIFCWV